MSIQRPSSIPEDGFDSDEEDFQESPISTNWVVRKTFLEIQSSEKESQLMRLCRSDTWLVKEHSTTKGSSFRRESNDTTMCSSRSSTRESSAEDANMSRQKSV